MSSSAKWRFSESSNGCDLEPTVSLRLATSMPAPIASRKSRPNSRPSLSLFTTQARTMTGMPATTAGKRNTS
eukprot:2934553-Pyramimonas_sp.AAC.1